MRRIQRAVLAILPFLAACVPARGQDPNATAILDKAITALGGEERLARISAFKWVGTVTFNVNGTDRTDDVEFTARGLDHLRRQFGLNLMVVAGDKAWQKRGDRARELMADAVAREKRSIYLQVIPVTLVPLKGKDYKCQAAGEEKVGEKPAAVVKVTAPDGKDFTLFFDKETGLPVKEVAQLEIPGGREVRTETTFADYKDFGGIKKATRIAFKSAVSGVEDLRPSATSRYWRRCLTTRSPSRNDYGERSRLPSERVAREGQVEQQEPEVVAAAERVQGGLVAVGSGVAVAHPGRLPQQGHRPVGMARCRGPARAESEAWQPA